MGLEHQLEAAAFIGGIGHEGNEEVIVSRLEGIWWSSAAETFSQQWSRTIWAVPDLDKAVEKHSQMSSSVSNSRPEGQMWHCSATQSCVENHSVPSQTKCIF